MSSNTTHPIRIVVRRNHSYWSVTLHNGPRAMGTPYTRKAAAVRAAHAWAHSINWSPLDVNVEIED